MNNTQALDQRYDAIGWGGLFIWWGITELFQFLPAGSWAIGIGLILIGVNTARSRHGIPVSNFSSTLAILALVLGGLEMAASILSLPFEIPIFAILLIVLGAIILTRALPVSNNQ
jgi:hydrogenase/urease accessory protein HupE